jgi:hypothetical protein
MGEDILRPALRAFLGVAGGDDGALHAALVDYADSHGSLLDGFRAAVTLHYFERLDGSKSPTVMTLRGAMADVLETIPEPELAESATARSELVNALRSRIHPGADRELAERRLWMRLREDYSAALGDRNFGRATSRPTEQSSATCGPMSCCATEG